MAESPSIPYGYCHCGCGQETTISPYTDRAKRWVGGEPRKYLGGHYAPRRRSDEEAAVAHDAKYVVNSTTGCWEWRGALLHGYGQLRFRGKTWLAHRYFYWRENGGLPDLPLDHLCRNPRCVNPAHLEPVTPKENCRRSSVPRLKRGQVAVIKRKLAAGRTQHSLANEYGVAKPTVGGIAVGRTWADV